MGASNRWPSSISELISRMEMRLRTPVTRGYFFLLGALRLVNAASPKYRSEKNILWNPGYFVLWSDDKWRWNCLLIKLLVDIQDHVASVNQDLQIFFMRLFFFTACMFNSKMFYLHFSGLLLLHQPRNECQHIFWPLFFVSGVAAQFLIVGTSSSNLRTRLSYYH